jgi:hypothetical protein
MRTNFKVKFVANANTGLGVKEFVEFANKQSTRYRELIFTTLSIPSRKIAFRYKDESGDECVVEVGMSGVQVERGEMVGIIS